MTHDNRARLRMFAETCVKVERLALNMDQVSQYNPPPNPAKVTDSRYAQYVTEHGGESWELDALEPQVIENLIRANIELHLDRALFDSATKRQDQARDRLSEIAKGLSE